MHTIIAVDNLKGNEYINVDLVSESGGIGRRTGLRIQPASADRGSNPLSRTRNQFGIKYRVRGLTSVGNYNGCKS